MVFAPKGQHDRGRSASVPTDRGPRPRRDGAIVATKCLGQGHPKEPSRRVRSDSRSDDGFLSAIGDRQPICWRIDRRKRTVAVLPAKFQIGLKFRNFGPILLASGFFQPVFVMRSPDHMPRRESKPASTGSGRLVNDLQNSRLPISPFKAWSPPGMKTGLRNQRIGRKISLVPFRGLEIDQAPPSQLAKVSETVTLPSRR
jgi:hypothetical protein